MKYLTERPSSSVAESLCCSTGFFRPRRVPQPVHDLAKAIGLSPVVSIYDLPTFPHELGSTNWHLPVLDDGVDRPERRQGPGTPTRGMDTIHN